ncbi:MAG: phosphoglycerate mutase family protein [Turicibacter sp.]|nr:phosphoglycerate mutase family protein [Turicibacter sp.]
MKKTLYIVRHGQTVFNLREKIQGWTDSPLTELGRRQPLYAKKWFADNRVTFTHAYSSTSERASDTLELITDMPYERLKGIKERNFGKFDGEAEALHIASPPFGDAYEPHGGESDDTFIGRVNKTFTDMMEKDGHDSVLAVAHAGVCGFFTYYWKPEMITHFGKNKSASAKHSKMQNCCILKYEYEDGKFDFIELVNHDFDQPL